MSIKNMLLRIGKEPPFRMMAKLLLKKTGAKARIRDLWEISDRPAYFMGMLAATEQAMKENVESISAIEFGVAGGAGLICMQETAKDLEEEFGIAIKVYGFDMGRHGLPDFIGDYRDHPDEWKTGDYPMDEELIKSKLNINTTLILGNVKETVAGFFHEYQPPHLGFISFDMDLYSSTVDALKLFEADGRRMLMHVPLYFDDVCFFFNHRYAGELLAIDEFNMRSKNVKLDRWRGVKHNRPFPERDYLDMMYVAHDVEAISNVTLSRKPGDLPLYK